MGDRFARLEFSSMGEAVAGVGERYQLPKDQATFLASAGHGAWTAV